VSALGRNVLLIHLLISALCTLLTWLPHLFPFFFSYFFLTSLLTIFFENRPAHFPDQRKVTKPGLKVVSVYFELLLCS